MGFKVNDGKSTIELTDEEGISTKGLRDDGKWFEVADESDEGFKCDGGKRFEDDGESNKRLEYVDEGGNDSCDGNGLTIVLGGLSSVRKLKACKAEYNIPPD